MGWVFWVGFWMLELFGIASDGEVLVSIVVGLFGWKKRISGFFVKGFVYVGVEVF